MKFFTDFITVEQYKRYITLMEKNNSDKREDAMFLNKKIIQGIFRNKIQLEELGNIDVMEFMTAVKSIHFIMQEVITEKMLNLISVEQADQEESAFDEYDIENGYEENETESNIWKSYREILDRIIKISIRILKDSYNQCMSEDIISLLEYLKFEIDTVDENK